MDAETKEGRGYGLLLVVLGSGLAALRQGYAAFSANHEEYMAQAFREFYPDFALNDWFVWKNVHFHVAFTKLVLVLLHLGIAEIGLCLIWVACVLWQFHCYFHLIRACGGKTWHMGLFIVIWAAIGPDGAGETRPVEGFLVPSMLGFTFMVGAVERLVRQRPYQAGVCAGIAGLFHIAFTVVGFPVLLAVMLAGPRDKGFLRRLVGTILLALLAASPTLIWTALHTGLSEQGLDAIYMIRSPHHTDPTYFPIRAWCTTIAVLILGLVTPLPSDSSQERTAARQVKALVGAISLVLGVSYISFIFGGPAALVRIVPWRFTSVAMLGSFILIAASASRRIWPGLAVAVVPVLAVIWGFPPIPAILSGAVPAVAWWIPTRYRETSNWLPLCLAFGLLFYLKGGEIVSPHYFTLKTRVPAAEWFKDHTPPGTIVLTPPDQVTFRILSHRAAYNTFKCFSVLNRQLSDLWLQRLKKQAGLDPEKPFPVPFRSYYLEWFLAGRYMNLPPEYLDRLAREENCDYILLPRLRVVLTVDDQGVHLNPGQLNSAIPPGLERLGWRKVYEDGDYYIYGRQGAQK